MVFNAYQYVGLSLAKNFMMANQFQLKKLFSPAEITNMVHNFGFKRMSEEEIDAAIQRAFLDYILAALSEQQNDGEQNKRLYIEAGHHLDKSRKLLAGLPHPAGKMSYRLSKMIDTLNKLIDGRINFASERATRFMEKNLVRRLRDIWHANTSTPFHPNGDNSGRNPRDFLLCCFAAAGHHYPEIIWFNEVDNSIADQLIKSIKR